MKKAYFSKRLYKADMGIPTVNELSYVIELFNRAKRFAFSNIGTRNAMEAKII
jgi:hypothetical protein